MKIKAIGVTKENKFILNIILRSIDSFYFDKINIFLTDEDEIKIYEKEASISINTSNIFICSEDKKVIEAFIRIQCEKLNLKRMYDADNEIYNLAASRCLIKNGFADEIAHFYYWYLAIKNKQVCTVEDFIDINIPWLSFYKSDEHNSNMFKDMLKGFVFHGELNEKCRKFFNSAKSNDYEKINKEYVMLCK